jgi:hypothetical protein
MVAAIAPKMPKSSGELAQVPLDDGSGAVVERAIAEPGRAEQGGGPDSPDTRTTPGPQPDNRVTDLGQTGAATGDVNARGAPRGAAPAGEGSRQTGGTATKTRDTSKAPAATKKSARK